MNFALAADLAFDHNAGLFGFALDISTSTVFSLAAADCSGLSLLSETASSDQLNVRSMTYAAWPLYCPALLCQSQQFLI